MTKRLFLHVTNFQCRPKPSARNPELDSGFISTVQQERLCVLTPNDGALR